jgi:hypothetical protein
MSDAPHNGSSTATSTVTQASRRAPARKAGGRGGSAGAAGAGTRLDDATKSPPGCDDGRVWVGHVWDDEGEVTVQLRGNASPARDLPSCCEAARDAGLTCRKHPPAPPDHQRSRRSAANRAAVKVRRYAVRNRLTRMVTLTYAEGVHDPVVVERDVSAFIEALRRERFGGRKFAYLWVREWHKTGHGIHVHILVGAYVPEATLRACWGRGFVSARRMDRVPTEPGEAPLRRRASARTLARRGASYVAKYVRKTFEDEAWPPGTHRYDKARGYEGTARTFAAASWDEARAIAVFELGGELPAVTFFSEEYGEKYEGPPLRVMFWA